MTGLDAVLSALALLAVAVVAGCYLDGALVLLPAQRRLSGPAYIEVEQANTAVGSVRYRMLLACALALQLVLLVATHDLHQPRFWLTATSAGVLAGATVAITIRRVVPINRLVHSWNPRHPPDEWARVRDRWHRLHRQRTIWAGLALLAQLAALLAH